jgi:hypothetical protein
MRVIEDLAGDWQDWYRQRVSGINFYGSTRHVFTTRRDGAIYLSATATSASIDTSSHQLSSAVARNTLLGSI